MIEQTAIAQGITAEELVTISLTRQFVESSVVLGSTSYQLSENGERLLRESIEDFEQGRYSTYESLEELNQAMEEIARG